MADDKIHKTTLRQAITANLSAKKRVKVGKLRGTNLFRTAIRLVIEYKEWIGVDDSANIGDDVTANVKLAQRKKSSQQELNVKDRGMLLIPSDNRSKEDIAYIYALLRNIKAFHRYPEEAREALASVCFYQYVPEGKTIIRQDHKAKQLYYIVRGQLQIFRDVTDSLTGEVTQIDAGILTAGDMFGEIALLHRVPRTATVVSKTSADLLVVTKEMFNMYLRGFLLQEWDVLRDALVNFNYFKGWTAETMRECCILSKILKYEPNEVLLGDGKGMIHYVYFILSGECRLVEHMLVEKKRVGQRFKYKLYDSIQKERMLRQTRVAKSKKPGLTEDQVAMMMESAPEDGNIGQEDSNSPDDYIKLLSSKKSNTNIAIDRISVITVTLQDVINQWHEITEIVETLMKRPEPKDSYPKNVEMVFMQICNFYRGACFGLGEKMKNRRVVALTPCKCLLIPRYWLIQHNRANIWEKVEHFMNSIFPNDQELLERYIQDKTWVKHKKDYAKKILKCGRNVPNETKISDVPYSIRINETNVDE